MMRLVLIDVGENIALAFPIQPMVLNKSRIAPETIANRTTAPINAKAVGLQVREGDQADQDGGRDVARRGGANSLALWTGRRTPQNPRCRRMLSNAATATAAQSV